MYKSTLLGCAMAIMLFGAAPAYAQSQNDEAAQVAGLLGQIKALQAQLSQLLGTHGGVDAGAEDYGLEIKSRLRLGSQGEEVRALQELLAKDAMVYPEGLITGFFGPKTAEAVKRLQAKYGLEAVGEVGPLTREKIKEWRKTFKHAMKAGMNEKKMNSSGTGSGASSNTVVGSGSATSNTSDSSSNIDSIVDSILGDTDDVNEADVTDSIPDATVSVSE